MILEPLSSPVQNVTLAYYHVIRDRLGVATPPCLKRLVTLFLADELPHFQSGPHNPVEDAVASLKINKKFKANWETIPRSHPTTLSGCRPAGMEEVVEDRCKLHNLTQYYIIIIHICTCTCSSIELYVLVIVSSTCNTV